MVNKQSKGNAKTGGTIGKKQGKSKLVEFLAFRLQIAYFKTTVLFSVKRTFVSGETFFTHMSLKEKFI